MQSVKNYECRLLPFDPQNCHASLLISINKRSDNPSLMIQKQEDKTPYTTHIDYTRLHQINNKQHCYTNQDVIKDTTTFWHNNCNEDMHIGNGAICWHIKFRNPNLEIPGEKP